MNSHFFITVSPTCLHRSWGLILSMAMMIAAGATTRACGQCCESYAHPPPPPPSTGCSCEEYEFHEGGDDGRIAIVVNKRLHAMKPEVATAIENFKNNLLADHDVVVAKWEGDGSKACTEDLRSRLHELWSTPESLTGAVLVGDLAVALWEQMKEDVVPPRYIVSSTDAYFMDLDPLEGTWLDDNLEPSFQHGIYDRWLGDRVAEIWVSRILVHNLSIVDPGTRSDWPEETLISKYFARNSNLRGEIFKSHYEPGTCMGGLVYAEDSLEFPGVIRDTMLPAFSTVFDNSEGVCDASTTRENYLARVGRDLLADPPTDPPYHFIHEASHGSQTTHFFKDVDGVEEYISGQDYADEYSQAYGFTLASCYVCDFAAPNYLGGFVAFSPQGTALEPNKRTKTLIVLGFSMEMALVQDHSILWNEVGVGRCFGEAFKAQFNSYSDSGIEKRQLGMVLLGDGTLKADSHCWVGVDGGGDGIHWDDFSNWETSLLPEFDGHVCIGAAATTPVRVDAGSLEEPDPVWSIALKDGASLEIESQHGLQLSSSFWTEPQANCTLTMRQQSTLQLTNSNAEISNATIVLDPDPSETTSLEVAGTIRECEVEAGQGTYILAGSVNSGCFGSIAGLVDVESGIHDAEFTVGSNGDVSTDLIKASVFVVEPGGRVVSDTNIDTSRFQIGESAYVFAGSGVQGDLGAEQGWTIHNGTVEANGHSQPFGSLELVGEEASATFERMSAKDGRDFQLRLLGGSAVEIEQLPAYHISETFLAPFQGNGENELVYGFGTNRFGGGRAESASTTDWLYLGDHTLFRPVTDEGCELELDVRAELRIASDFTEGVVREEWDSRNVDITIPPIWATTQWEDPHGPDEPDDKLEQAVELISPPFPDGLGPVIFLDAPCKGTFRDFTLADWVHECPDDDTPLEVTMRDYYRNRGTSGSDGRLASARFRNIVIGRDRTLMLYSTHGRIYHYGTIVMRSGANVYLDDDYETKFDTYPASMIVAVAGSIVGDWNGDCAISNVEIAQLQAAIQGGPATYNSLMDSDCDGRLTVEHELNQVLANAVVQPSCTPPRAREGGERDGEPGITSWRESSEPEPLERYDDVPGLAAWLTETLTEDQRAEFIIELDDAAARFAEEPIGEDMIELLYHLR